MAADVLVVGAGVAGLSCARVLMDSGAAVTVLDRARGVGGRCATRRFDDVPVDFGVVFLHGASKEFLAALETTDGTPLPNWPQTISGRGAPCQPDAFAPFEQRVAFVEGVSRFPKTLARGLDVWLQRRVDRVEVLPHGFRVRLAIGESVECRDLVLATALEQASKLLVAIEGPAAESLRPALALLEMLSSVPSLTLIAGYERFVPAPAWDVMYPEDSRVFQLVSHESTKRDSPLQRMLVYQARPAWSRARLQDPPEVWTNAMLLEAEKLLGRWAGTPRFTSAHRWEFARVDRATELAAPLCLELPGGQRLGLAGDVWMPGGGVEAAFLSGRRLGQMLGARRA